MKRVLQAASGSISSVRETTGANERAFVGEDVCLVLVAVEDVPLMARAYKSFEAVDRVRSGISLVTIVKMLGRIPVLLSCLAAQNEYEQIQMLQSKSTVRCKKRRKLWWTGPGAAGAIVRKYCSERYHISLLSSLGKGP
jgi:hypothetical protein